MIKKFTTFAFILALGAVSIFAQTAQLRTAVAGQKYKIKGVVIAKESENTFIVRDAVGVDTKVVVEPNASIKNNAFFGGDKYAVNSIVRGLNMEVEGVGDSAGSVSVRKVRFDKSNLMTA